MKKSVLLALIVTSVFSFISTQSLSGQEWLPKKSEEAISIPALAEELVRQGVDHWKIVLAQAIVESGWRFESYLFKRTNNFMGMRIPYARESMRVSDFKGYSVYGTWKDCVKDIKMWQLHNWDGGTSEDYIALMHDIWSESPKYYDAVSSVSRRIDRMIARQKDRKAESVSFHELHVNLLQDENILLGDL